MSFAACAALVEKGDPDRFAAAMAATPAERRALFPLYAFNLEVARAPWATREPLIARMRLQWWRDVVANAATGADPRAHEVAAPLADLIAQKSLPMSVFSTLITAREWDIDGDPFAREEDVVAHIDRGAGSLAVLTCLALGASPDAEPDLREAAIAGGIANWLLAVPALEAIGKRPLAHATTGEIKTLADYGLRMLAKHKSRDFGAATAALRAGWRARAVLQRALKYPETVPAGQLAPSEIRRRFDLLRLGLLGGWTV